MNGSFQWCKCLSYVWNTQTKHLDTHTLSHTHTQSQMPSAHLLLLLTCGYVVTYFEWCLIFMIASNYGFVALCSVTLHYRTVNIMFSIVASYLDHDFVFHRWFMFCQFTTRKRITSELRCVIVQSFSVNYMQLLLKVFVKFSRQLCEVCILKF